MIRFLIGKLNKYFLRWFWIRLAMIIDEETQDIVDYTIIYVTPKSGYNTRYKYWRKKDLHLNKG